MKSAAIYARVSSDKQKEENTIASQTAALIEFAQGRGYDVPVDRVFEDEGYSGASLVRPGLERLRDLAAEGQLEAILVYAPDRLSRKYAYQILLMEEFARAGVEIVFIKAPQGETPEDQLLLQFQGMIAEYERAQILERSRRGKRHRARQGQISVLSGAPYGYRYVRKSEETAATYQIIETEAHVVRLVYERYTVRHLSIGAITRLLNERGVPTRKQNSRWERSTVWAMLRNPAYKGSACFGKTELRPRQRITRPLRLRGGLATRDSASHERPRADWIEIPVPAIVGEDTFALAQERLHANKTHAPRRTIEPSIVQGLVSCSKCGYALTRTSTHSSARKIHYYRCLGSDAWRHLGGTVCGNRPVRQDLLDEVVWREISRLLENPNLIDGELERRLTAAREAAPTKRREEALRRDLARLRKGMDRLMTAYQEDLLSLDELRCRMPELRQREKAIHAELQSIAAQAQNRAAHLHLAETLSAFLKRLRSAAESLDIYERQRIVRLLVKEVLVGDDTIVIRHSIPITATPPRNEEPPVPSEKSPPSDESYLLRSGRHDCPLGRASRWRPSVETLQDIGLQPITDHAEHATVDDVLLDPSDQTIMRNRVEVALQVGVNHEGIAVLDQLIGLPQSVMAPTLRTEAVAAVGEAVLENRLDDEADGLLDDAVLDRGDAQRPRSAVALRDVHSLDGLRKVTTLSQRRRQLRQIEICLCREPLDRLPVHTRGPFVGADLRPRQGQCPGCEHLVYQAEPLAAFDAVHQRRQHTLRPHLGFGPRKSWAGLCIARSRRRHSRCCSCLGHGLHVSTFLPCLPSGPVYAPRPFRARFGPGHCGTMRALTPRRLARAAEASPLTLHRRPSIPPPTT